MQQELPYSEANCEEKAFACVASLRVRGPARAHMARQRPKPGRGFEHTCCTMQIMWRTSHLGQGAGQSSMDEPRSRGIGHARWMHTAVAVAAGDEPSRGVWAGLRDGMQVLAGLGRDDGIGAAGGSGGLGRWAGGELGRWGIGQVGAAGRAGGSAGVGNLRTGDWGGSFEGLGGLLGVGKVQDRFPKVPISLPAQAQAQFLSHPTPRGWWLQRRLALRARICARNGQRHLPGRQPTAWKGIMCLLLTGAESQLMAAAQRCAQACTCPARTSCRSWCG